MKLEGSYTALITPFNDKYEIDEEGYRQNIDFQIGNGTNGLLPVGTTGESATMTHDEHKRIMDIAVDQANGKIPVLTGAGSNNTLESLDLCKHAENTGADAVLIVVPYYNKPTQEGLYQHYKKIAESIEIPVVVYNIPSRTGVNMTPETLLRLAEIDNIIGVKEASGDINQMMKIIKAAPNDFSVMSGDDGLTLPLMALGGRGVVSVVSNIVPDKVAKMCDLLLGNKIEEAIGIFDLSTPDNLPLQLAKFIYLYQNNNIINHTSLYLSAYNPVPAVRGFHPGNWNRGWSHIFKYSLNLCSIRGSSASTVMLRIFFS